MKVCGEKAITMSASDSEPKEIANRIVTYDDPVHVLVHYIVSEHVATWLIAVIQGLLDVFHEHFLPRTLM